MKGKLAVAYEEKGPRDHGGTDVQWIVQQKNLLSCLQNLLETVGEMAPQVEALAT